MALATVTVALLAGAGTCIYLRSNFFGMPSWCKSVRAAPDHVDISSLKGDDLVDTYLVLQGCRHPPVDRSDLLASMGEPIGNLLVRRLETADDAVQAELIVKVLWKMKRHGCYDVSNDVSLMDAARAASTRYPSQTTILRYLHDLASGTVVTRPHEAETCQLGNNGRFPSP